VYSESTAYLEFLIHFLVQGIDVNCNVQQLLGKLNDHKQLMLALAASDDVAVGRLVKARYLLP
jgi:hypothetical protein